MSIPFSTEQRELADTIRRFLAERVTSEYLRKKEGSVSDVALFKDLIDLGLLTSFMPESLGGVGFGFRELGLLAEEVGRALLPEPILEMAFSLYILSRSSVSDFAPEKFNSIFAGDSKVIFIPDCVVSSSFVAGKIDLQVGVVFGGAQADYAIIDISEGLFLVDLSGVNKAAASLVDSTITAVTLSGVGCQYWKIKSSDLAESMFGILKALEIVGAADRGIQMSLDHVKTRKQFEVPIGSFQAVQHKLAEAYVNLSAMRSLATFAAWAVENSPEQVMLAGSSAISFAADKGPKILETCVQMHGGTGFTWEYDLHLYLRRTKMLSVLLADMVGSDDILRAV